MHALPKTKSPSPPIQNKEEMIAQIIKIVQRVSKNVCLLTSSPYSHLLAN